MKLFFISDIHGALPSLERALVCFEAEGADKLIILGDALYHGPRNPLPEGYAPADVAERLNQYKSKIIAIRGNCDSEVDQMLIEYPMMETSAQLYAAGRTFFLTHGHVYNAETHPPLLDGTILCYGHTHLPVAKKRGTLVEFNPGSISLPKGGNPPSYGLFTDGELQVKTFAGELLCAISV